MTKRTLACLCTLMVAATVALAGDDKSEIDDGPLHKNREHVRELVNLEWKQDSIALNRQWAQEDANAHVDKTVERLKKRGMDAQKIAVIVASLRRQQDGLSSSLNKLRQAVGASTSGRMGSGEGVRRTFSGGVLSGSAVERGKLVRLSLREETESGRMLDVLDDGHGGVRVSLIDPTGKLVVVLTQQRDGSAKLLWVDTRETRRIEAGSMMELYAENATFLEEKVFPTLDYLGVGLPLRPMDKEVREEVIRQLGMSADDDRLKEGKQLVRQLDGEDYETREEAMKVLSENYLKYREAIVHADRNREGMSAEARNRLNRILAENKEADRLGRLVDSLKLTSDWDYLVRLLDVTEDKGKQALVLARLGEVTDQEFGADTAAWKAWAQNRRQEEAEERRKAKEAAEAEKLFD